jgi:anaerobic magnesium-protoporphyrin IX monomethyl ester cyclase
MKKIINIVKESLDKPVDLDDKHLRIMEAILPYARAKPQTNLTEIKINNVTRKTKIRFFLLPEWAINFPPYNLARLIAVAKEAGYQADGIDLNIESYVQRHKWDIDFNPWHGSKEWRWMGESYHQYLHKYVEPLMEKTISNLEKDNIDVVSFSLYYCNQEPTDWMAAEIKKRYPHIKILVGGPQCHAFPPGQDKPFYDYVVSGEGEEILLKILDDIENKSTTDTQVRIIQDEGQRLDLDKLPWADYSHFNLSNYQMPNGVNAEFSRGCTAKCVFCSETHFWKYRGRGALNTLNEIIFLYENYNIDFIWFLDSLVNGNLKELQAFCKGVIASGIAINWTGYARCDKRMDLNYYKDLAGSGCKMLSYGIESGSNKVLLDMDKRVTVDEIEQNLYHGWLTGVEAHSNWIIGFPTEEPQDFYESMTLIWRNRDYLDVIACGHGFTEPPDTIISQNSEKYGMIKAYYMNNWITKDFKNSKVHRAIRLVTFNIFLRHTAKNFANFDTEKYHQIKFDNIKFLSNLSYETFDFNIIKPNINPLADSVVNEIWPLLRILWLARGGYETNINLKPQDLNNEFGDRLGCNFTASYIFKIDFDGNWTADFTFNFIENDNPWKYQDYSREESTSAKRARMLAIPNNKGEIVWNLRTYDKHLALIEQLKKTNFSFEFKYNSHGKWIRP